MFFKSILLVTDKYAICTLIMINMVYTNSYDKYGIYKL